MISFLVILSTLSLCDLESGSVWSLPVFFDLQRYNMYEIVRNSPNFNQAQRVGVNVTKYDNVITKSTIIKLVKRLI